MNWLQRQWNDVKGNAKWWLLGLAVTTTGSLRAFLWCWLQSQSRPVLVLLLIVGLETVLLILATIALSRVKKSRSEIGTNTGLRSAAAGSVKHQQNDLDLLGSRSKLQLKERLAFGVDDKVGNEFAIRVYMQNIDTAPIKHCRLALTMFGKWHPERREFRAPTFSALTLSESTQLEPEKMSPQGLLVRLTDLSATELEIPTGGALGQRELCRTAGRWRAEFEIGGDGEKYREQIIFRWSPGVAPTLVVGGSKQPMLEYANFSTVGFSDQAAAHQGFDAPEGLAFFLRNAETRFQTQARNMRAFLRLRSTDDQEVSIENAPWFQNLASEPQGRFYKSSVSLGMLETAGVVCAIKSNSHFFVASHDSELRPAAGQELTYGDWYFDLRVEGDNVWREFNGKLQFLPNGASGFTPAETEQWLCWSA